VAALCADDSVSVANIFEKARQLFNPLNTKLNPICHLLALLGARHILDVSRIRVKELGAKAPSKSTGPVKDFALGCGPGTNYPPKYIYFNVC